MPFPLTNKGNRFDLNLRIFFEERWKVKPGLELILSPNLYVYKFIFEILNVLNNILYVRNLKVPQIKNII